LRRVIQIVLTATAGYKNFESKENIVREYPIIVSDVDVYRLRGLLGAARGESLDLAHLDELRNELERAIVLPAGEVPHGVVTMGAKVQVRDLGNGRIEGFELVYPRDADAPAHRLSVLAPLGTALLGNSQGDAVEWRMPGGTRCFRIERVMQAPRRVQPGVANALEARPA
jgi:regulator of nucleoside diphosphate kinase